MVIYHCPGYRRSIGPLPSCLSLHRRRLPKAFVIYKLRERRALEGDSLLGSREKGEGKAT